jgi:hypothetical protein
MAGNVLTVQFGGAVELKLLPAEPAPVGYVLVTAKFEGFSAITKGDAMYQLPVGMLVKVQIAYVDAAGNPAKIDGDVVWTSSAEGIATVAVDPGDSTIATISAVGPVGSSQVVATADADLGGGVRELLTTLEIGVVAGEAVAGTINVLADPEPIAPHVAPVR